MRGLVLGTGPSLAEIADLVPQFDGLIFGPNNTYQDFKLDVWLACDPAWHSHYGNIHTQNRYADFDKWHWDPGICETYGYRYVEGVWMVNGVTYPRSEYVTPPGPCGEMWMSDKSRISLNHGSCPQLINLACNQYECSEVILVGHDFHYAGKRHYFDDLSGEPGEYPANLRKWSKFEKQNDPDDLMSVYRRMGETPGIPRIVNCTPNSRLPWFPMGDFRDYVK